MLSDVYQKMTKYVQFAPFNMDWVYKLKQVAEIRNGYSSLNSAPQYALAWSTMDVAV